jgi:hypothetical protein
MRPQSKTDLAKVQRALSGLDVRDRCVVLVMSFVHANQNSFLGPILGLMNCIAQMSREASINQRFQVAEALRNAADDIERQVRDERCQV